MFLSQYADNVWNWHEQNIWVDHKHEYDDQGEVTQVCDFADWHEKLDDESLTDIAELPYEFAVDLRQVIDKAITRYLNENNPYTRALRGAAE